MKNTIKILAFAAAVSVLGSCTNKFEEYNQDEFAVKTADPAILLPSMIDALMYIQQNKSQMVDQMVGTLGGYFTLSNRWSGQNFDTFNASDDWNSSVYSTIFTDIYSNFFKIEESTKGSGHYYAVASLIRAAAMLRVADCYGPIPYSLVQNGKMYVAYDTNEAVYKNIINDLENAATVLFDYTQQYPASKPMGAKDLIYEGDYALWAKFGNSLALRAAMRSGDEEAVKAAIDHPAGLILENAENAMMSPGVQGNPYQLAAVTWGDLRANSSIVDYMNGYQDPRLELYFTKSSFSGYTDRYVGMRSGQKAFDKSEVQGYSMPACKSSDALPVFVAAETHFLLAEAALKGWYTKETPQALYEKGVRLSMGQYGVEGDRIDAYLADATSRPANHEDDPLGGGVLDYTRKSTITVAWNDGDDNEKKLERIITQKWIANYPLGLEAWAEYRRTGYPDLAPAIDNLSPGQVVSTQRGMRRLRFPFTEKDLNRANYDEAVRMIGGTDNEAVDLFWTKKN